MKDIFSFCGCRNKIRIFFSALIILVFCVANVLEAAPDIVDVSEMISSIPKDWPAAPDIPAKAAILIDRTSGEILYAKNATDAMYPASTTKLMTALLTLESCELSDVVSFSRAAVSIPANSSHIGMRRDEKMVLKECLYALLLPSANEVANALAEHISGSAKSFAARMNERAYQLGAVNTSFKNANGLHNEAHYTCAYDLALMMKACVENDTFREISGTPSYVHHSDDLLPKDIPMTNTNMMIRKSSEYYNEYINAGKTGHTDESGYNLVTSAEKDGMKLIAVVMGCAPNSHYVATQALLDYGFHYFHQILPAELDDSLRMEHQYTSSRLEIPMPDVSLLKINSSDTILLPENVTFDMLEKKVEETETGKRITYTYQDYPLGTVELLYETGDEKIGFLNEEGGEVLKKEEVPDFVTIDGYLLLFLGGLFLILLLVFLWVKKYLLPKKKKKIR